MTRTIKFRAWDKIDKRWIHLHSINFRIANGNDLAQITEHCTDKFWNMPNDYELMQFTGLLDKNGKEIYEGDIVKHDYATGEEFVSGGLMVVGNETPDGQKIIGLEMFDPKCSTTYSFDANNEKQDDVEIIGNVYENPGLLD